MQGCRCMKHFKSLKPGMSLLEVVFAIAVLAVFGSSLFMMQQYLSDRMMVSQTLFIASLRMQQEFAAYQKNILEEYFENKGKVEKAFQEKVKEFTHPDMTIKITTKLDLVGDGDHKESAFKNYKNVRLISVHASTRASDREHGMIDYGSLYYFVYVPEVAKQ